MKIDATLKKQLGVSEDMPDIILFDKLVKDSNTHIPVKLKNEIVCAIYSLPDNYVLTIELEDIDGQD